MGKQLEMFSDIKEDEIEANKIRELINSEDPANQLLGLQLCRSLGYSKVKFVQEYFAEKTPNKWFQEFTGGLICHVYFGGLVFYIYDEGDLMIIAQNVNNPSKFSTPMPIYTWKDEFTPESIDRDVNRNIKKFVQEYFFDLLSLLK
jgi:hypothetical protein